MTLKGLLRLLPSWQNALLAVLSAVLLILAFPPFEWWVTAWFALVPLLWAVERDRSPARSFVLGWLFGNIFFYGTCWWLTFAPIAYASFPAPLAYLLLFCVTSAAAVFPAIFAAITAFLLRRFTAKAFLAVPFVWLFSEFARYWITGNNWNAIGYSQAFNDRSIGLASYGGVLLMSFTLVLPGAAFLAIRDKWRLIRDNPELVNTLDAMVRHEYGRARSKQRLSESFFDYLPHIILIFVVVAFPAFVLVSYLLGVIPRGGKSAEPDGAVSRVVAVQPNVPMSGLTIEKWQELRRRHVQLAESALVGMERNPQSAVRSPQLTVVFPESPMNFMYEEEPETKKFINGFAAEHNVSMLFNSAEPDPSTGKYFNSAVLVGPEGREVAQYDKIYLLPFGEAVPFPLGIVMPAFVGTFSRGQEYDLLPLGDAKAGVMICFESHFGQLSREYVRNGADVIIEMTNDGYLGPTPVLRQHLANAVFRAVETNRPVLRVTNVGITAYINERGEVLDAAESYVEDTRVWSVAKSDGSQTFYVKYGDWFAWLCSLVTIGLLAYAFFRRRQQEV